MALQERIPVDDLALGLVLIDPLLIMLRFWEGDMTMPDGSQEISLEQRSFLCDESDRVLLCSGRQIGKTLSLERDIIQIGITHERIGTLDEGIFFTPGQAQMDPVRDRIFSKIVREPLFYEMIERSTRGTAMLSKGDGYIQFKTGYKWQLRIEGTSGTDTNMVGLRNRFIIGDEMAFGNELCHRSRVNSAQPGCKWKYCGVPNGVRGTPFWKLDQTEAGSAWSRHKYPQFANPIFASESERKRLITDHGGEHTHSYITQVLGMWGDEVMSSFPPGTIATYSSGQYSYHLHEWTKSMGTRATYRAEHLDSLVKQLGEEGQDRCVIGWDYGMSPDPCAISLFFEHQPGVWYLRVMYVMYGIPFPHQCEFLNQLEDRFNVAFLCTDEALGVQQLSYDARWTPYSEEEVTGNIQWANLNGRIELLDGLGMPVLDELGNTIKEQRKKWSTDELRNAMIHARENLTYPYKIWLPEEDKYLLDELMGTTEHKTAGGYTQYLTAKKTEGSKSPDDHRTDACRYAVLGMYSLLGSKYVERRRPFSEYRSHMGWSRGGSKNWKAPWGK